MSDRAALTVRIYRCDGLRRPSLREYVDDELQPQLGDGFTEGAMVEEMVLGSVEKVMDILVGIDSSIAAAVWQDPKYEYLGDIQMVHPGLGRFVGDCGPEGVVVCTWDQVEQVLAHPVHPVPDAEALAWLYGEPWLRAFARLVEQGVS